MKFRRQKMLIWYNRTQPEDQIIPLDEHVRLSSPLTDLGLTWRGWQLYVINGDCLLEALGQPWIDDARPRDSLTNAIAFFNLLAQCDGGQFLLPPRALVGSIHQWCLPDDRLDVIPYRMLQTCWEACAAAEYKTPSNKAALAHTIKNQVVPVAQWFFTTRKHKGQRCFHWQHEESLKWMFKFGWRSLKPAYEKWQTEERRQREETSPAPAQWDPLIENVVVGKLKFLALASDDALFLEGLTMLNCVGDYGRKCRKDGLRVFSVRRTDDGGRVATLSLEQSSPGMWRIEQLRGKDNSTVHSSIRRTCRSFLARIHKWSEQSGCATQGTKKPLAA